MWKYFFIVAYNKQILYKEYLISTKLGDQWASLSKCTDEKVKKNQSQPKLERE